MAGNREPTRHEQEAPHRIEDRGKPSARARRRGLRGEKLIFAWHPFGLGCSRYALAFSTRTSGCPAVDSVSIS